MGGVDTDSTGKSRLEAILIGMYPAEPLVKATIHESGQTATVQVADEYFRYRRSEPAKKILQGKGTVCTSLDVAQFFALIKEAK